MQIPVSRSESSMDRMYVDEEKSNQKSSSDGVTGVTGDVCEEDEDLMQDKLLEELLRLRLTDTSGTPSASASASSTSMLPPKQRIKLFQPRSKFEQFKDILQESQLRHHCCEAQSHKDDEVGLRNSWFELKDGISSIYSSILSGSNHHHEQPQTDLGPLQERVAQLTWKDPHQLYVRLESAIREFVIDLKLILIELLQKQAKNPSLAQEFIQSLLDGYEKICNAAAYASPALQELEMGHLRLFGLTWEVMNKHLYQSIIYTDPLIQNNLPIFISQLRSLYPDKEHEARYTELVRSYLDFDVEMEKIGAFWKISEPLIANYNKEQAILMEKQKMLREDWEKFKMQRKNMDKQLKEESGEHENGQCSDASQSDEKSDENTEGSKENEDCECHACASLASISQTLTKCAITADSVPNCPPSSSISNSASNLDLYPHIHGSSDLSNTTTTLTTTITSSTSSYCLSQNFESSNSNNTNNNSAIAANAEDSKSSLSLPDKSSSPLCSPAPSPTSTHSIITTTSSSSSSSSLSSSSQSTSVVSASTSKTIVTSTATSTTSTASKRKVVCSANHGNSREINKLLQQHYCGHKRMPPSASAVRKGKVPPPPPPPVQGREEEEDYTEDGESCSSSSASADSKHCSCCCCEVFGHGGPSVAPVSRNYPEMRERLRLLLNKKKKCKQQQQQQQIKLKSGCNINNPSPKGNNDVSNSHQQQQQQRPVPVPISTSASTSKISDKDVGKHHHGHVPAPSQQNKNSKVSKSASQPNLNDLKTKDVEELLEYIEGNLKTTTNEKKRAKKDRQKQQRLEEQRRREEEERLKKQKEEEERRLREEEQRRDQERAHQLLKKRTKKEKQKAKKAAAKGLPPPNSNNLDFQKDAAQKLEELKAQHLREVEQLKLLQQQQLEETQRSLLLQHQRNSKTTAPSTNSNKSGSKQVRITRTPNGGVEFSTVEDNPSSSSVSSSSSSPPALSTASMAFANNGMMFKPSIIPSSSKHSSNQPMVTIKRVHTGDGESTVTISTKNEKTQNNANQSSKLLYTLINGQVHKSQHAPADLIPGAKTLASSCGDNGEANLSKKQRKKLRKQFKSVEELRSASPLQSANDENDVPLKSVSTSALKGLPTTPEGKLDLDNLNLPPGISITRIEGPVPERKYYPKPQETTPSATTTPPPPPSSMMVSPSSMFPGGLMPAPNQCTPVGYSAMAGMPSSLNGPNVIVVDTSTLTTREEEEAAEKSSKKNKKKNKKAPMQHQSQPLVNNNNNTNSNSFPGFLQPEIPPPSAKQDNGSNGGGPQVLIKNVNGQVVITPVPGTGATHDSIPAKLNGNPNSNNKKSKIKGGGGGAGKENQAKVVLLKNNANLLSATTNGHALNSEEIMPNGHNNPVIDPSDPSEESACQKNKKNKKSKKKSSIGENIDEINSIFAPKDIDLENGEIDDDEREIEAFKRFCFNSVPLQQKTKVNFDVKNIAFKKK